MVKIAVNADGKGVAMGEVIRGVMRRSIPPRRRAAALSVKRVVHLPSKRLNLPLDYPMKTLLPAALAARLKAPARTGSMVFRYGRE